jgi:hypothetical protein
MIVRYCEFETSKGPCGTPFRVPSNQSSSQRFCVHHMGQYEGHRTKSKRAGLVKSRNIYSKAGNEQKMREFIISKMASAKKDAKTIADLEKRISKLENGFERNEGNQKKMVALLQKESKKQWFTAIIESIMIARVKKLNEKIVKLEKKIDSMRE